MARTVSTESQRRTIYLLAGAAAGIAIMILPALFLVAGSQVPALGGMRQEFFEGRGPFAAYATASPLEVFLEVLWLVLPALIVILALYWLAAHRTRWAGYDEAAKWSRR